MSANTMFSGPARIEVVDDRHERWPSVLEFIDRVGERERLQFSDDGGISTRQAVLAAFLGDQVVGHLAFHVEPLLADVAAEKPRSTLLAKLDGCSVADGQDQETICTSLRTAAIDWARRIRCDADAIAV